MLLDQSVPFVILRHDVDACLESALKIAQVESEELAISSTYFILYGPPHYTFLDTKSAKIVKEISKLGHEIGFHYDCTIFEFVEDKKNLLLKMIEVFENLCEVTVTSISCHNPSLYSTDYFLDMLGYINVTSPAFKNDMFYVSDSVATWRKGVLRKILKQPVKPKVQLLLHPFLWTREEYHGRKQILQELRHKRIADVERYFDQWEDMWDSYLERNASVLETGE